MSNQSSTSMYCSFDIHSKNSRATITKNNRLSELPLLLTRIIAEGSFIIRF